MNTVFIYSLGCRVNQYEAVVLKDLFGSLGYQVLTSPENASLIVVNTCALTSLARAKTRNNVRHFLSKSPNANVALTGCYAQTDANALCGIENVKWVVGNDYKFDLPNIIANNPPENTAKIFMSPYPVPQANDKTENAATTPLSDRSNIKIQDGCNNACSYCIIPRARGRARSRPLKEIKAEALSLAKRGVRELIITGINISQYKDENNTLLDVVDSLCSIDEILRVRIGSIEPPEFPLEELLQRMNLPNAKLARHLHIVAQNLCEKTLVKMRRKHTVADFLNMVKTAQAQCPDIAIGTDLICGHPDESESDFLECMDILQKSKLAYAHVFTFSAADKTLAKTMPNQIPYCEKKRRSDLMRKVAKQLHYNFEKAQLGKKGKILLENRLANGNYLGYTDNYMQCEVANLNKNGLKNTLVEANLAKITPQGKIEAVFDKIIV
ncbi:MAG: tRNA (N(6)-L-threonylcarbamoyladenosine(37)-C(2))-methylthiotransferase MtaB [Opitutales bacterium]|nr:tRNA (N(6)-L-threonylcarbamoyladenosine(37)-C(2))-methylthiotransferase MtaB [Opitutales bacterium]